MLRSHDISRIIVVNLFSLGLLMVGCGGGDGGCGEQGSSRMCVCDGGVQGSEYCQANGDFSPCYCNSSNAITGSGGSTSFLDGGSNDGSASGLGRGRVLQRDGGSLFTRPDSGGFRSSP